MHELSICQALLSQVVEIARAHGASSVRQIFVAVGPLSGVEPSLLTEAFRWVRADSCAARAELYFEPDPVIIRCLECNAESACVANRLLCGKCCGFRTRVISGDEMRLLRVELESSEQSASAFGGIN